MMSSSAFSLFRIRIVGDSFVSLTPSSTSFSMPKSNIDQTNCQKVKKVIQINVDHSGYCLDGHIVHHSTLLDPLHDMILLPLRQRDA